MYCNFKAVQRCTMLFWAVLAKFALCIRYNCHFDLLVKNSDFDVELDDPDFLSRGDISAIVRYLPAFWPYCNCTCAETIFELSIVNAIIRNYSLTHPQVCFAVRYVSSFRLLLFRHLTLYKVV